MAHFFHADAPYHCDIHHLPLPSKTFYTKQNKRDTTQGHKEYSLFKKGIMPVWEDPKNSEGGCWFFRQYLSPDLLDHYWQNLVKGIVDEVIEDEGKTLCCQHINGVRIDDKSSKKHPMYKIEIWLDIDDVSIRDKIRFRVLKFMTDGKTTKKEHHLKLHWKSFAEKVHPSSDEDSAEGGEEAAPKDETKRSQ